MKILLAALSVSLALVSFSASACHGRIKYVGNPERVNTIWMPGQCDAKGIWHEGYYVQFKNPVRKSQLSWMPAQYDQCGNWVKGHWMYHHLNTMKMCHKHVCMKHCGCCHHKK
jgi:hypothetical protein